MVLLKESFTTFVTDMVPDVTAATAVPPVVLRQSVLLGETFATVGAHVRFRFWLRRSRWHYAAERRVGSDRTLVQLAHGSRMEWSRTQEVSGRLLECCCKTA
jgi:hypothetical protein